jgi:hypothetical protein
MKTILFISLLILPACVVVGQGIVQHDQSTAVEITPAGVRTIHNKPTYDSTNLSAGRASLGRLSSGIANTVIGDSNAVFLTNSSRNTLVGFGIMKLSTSGNRNSVMGAATANKFEGEGLIAMGLGALSEVIQSVNRIALGAFSGTSFLGNNSVSIGSQSGFNAIGSENIFVGASVGASVQQASRSIYIGGEAAGNAPPVASYYSGQDNIGIGCRAFRYNTNINNTVAVGYGILSNSTTNSTAFQNVIFGTEAMANAGTTVTRNVAIGNKALQNDIGSGVNIGIGHEALINFVNEGSYNIAIGSQAGGYAVGSTLYGFVGGGNNLLIGYGSGRMSVGRITNNVGVGSRTLQELANPFNASGYGYSHVALGYEAGKNVNDDDACTFIGAATKVSQANVRYVNSTAIGYGATITASNQIVFGNSAVTTVEGRVAWTNLSDRRLKKDIIYDKRLGLQLIKTLKPAYYEYKTDRTHRLQLGIIADDLQDYLTSEELQFSALRVADDPRKTKSIAYAELNLPLINAVQQLDAVLENGSKWQPLNLSQITADLNATPEQ